MVNLPTIKSLKSHIKKLIISSPRIVPGTEIGIGLNIVSLICPLRYDLIIRIEFFRFLEREWDLYTNNLPSFLDAAPVKNYYIWFKEISIARFNPDLYPHENLIKPKFIEQVHTAAALWKSLEDNGLDISNPICLMSGKEIIPVNGKITNELYFAGDGCHRLSYLYVKGVRTLPPNYYQVIIYKKFQPLDNTDILYKKLPLSTANYCKFISSYYCNNLDLNTVDEILQYVDAYRHDLLPVIRSIVATIKE